jgi:hypothetical protein
MNNQQQVLVNNTTTKPLNQNRMKQTAVEWLAEKYDYAYWMVKRDEISPVLAEEWKKHYLEQAKEMEKDNVCDAWDDGYDKGMRDRIEKISNPVGNAEQYYNETYKTKTIVTEFRDGSVKVETFKSE